MEDDTREDDTREDNTREGVVGRGRGVNDSREGRR